MEKEIIISICEWSNTETNLTIEELNYSRTFTHKIDAINWANSIFKKPKFENVVYS